MKLFKVFMTADEDTLCLIKAANDAEEAIVLAAVDLVNTAALDGNSKKVSVEVNPAARTMKVVDAGTTEVNINVEEINLLGETIKLEVN